MKDYAWPGNIRELRNLAERTVIPCIELEIEAADLPFAITKQSRNETSRFRPRIFRPRAISSPH